MWTRIIILIFLFLAGTANATVFVSEGWEDAPGNCWPCKTASCSQTYNGWNAYSPAEQGGSGAETTSGISTTVKNSGNNSLLVAKVAGSTDSCNIQYDFTEPYQTTLYFRFYLYLSDDFTAFRTATDGNIHWIFTNSYQSQTGFRFNIVNNSWWQGCPVNGICILPQGDGGNNEWWAGVSPAWTAGVNLAGYIGQWVCIEYKMQISGSNVVLTEYINGTQTQSATGPGQSGSSFQWVAFLDYENTSSASQLKYYIDDVVVSDSYIGPLAEGDTTAPTVTAFTIPSTAQSLTVDVNSLTCSDETALHSSPYCVTTTNSSAGCSWAASAPATVTFSAAGAQTAYGWCKDAADNVSSSSSDSVTITLPPRKLNNVTGVRVTLH